MQQIVQYATQRLLGVIMMSLVCSLVLSQSGGGPHLVYAQDVGVIPHRASCPSRSELIEIRMDDEDSGNNNHFAGWLGAIRQNEYGTLFRFCRVDGTQFRPLSRADSRRDYYAVLKLGAVCPPNGWTIIRYFDNEDDGNRNFSTGNIFPNVSNSNTELHFCLFTFAQRNSDIMSQFPNLGFRYGVFAPSDFSEAIDIGFLHTDDEDDNNQNDLRGERPAEARRIISGTRNTDIELARVW